MLCNEFYAMSKENVMIIAEKPKVAEKIARFLSEKEIKKETVKSLTMNFRMEIEKSLWLVLWGTSIH